MNIPEILQQPLAQNLAYRIVERLDGFSEVVEEPATRRIRITGRLALGDEEFHTKSKARCIFDVGPRWVEDIPHVACLEPWITRRPPEWHIGKDGSLCFEFSLHWRHELSGMVEQFTYGLTAEYAAAWLLNSTRSLLRRHLLAYRQGLTNWPQAWNYWPHGSEAAKRQLKHLLQKDQYASQV